MVRFFALMLALLAMAGCVRNPEGVAFHATGNPATLSEWGLFTVADGRIKPHAGVVTYDLATPLFSDYAQKWRTIWMPKGVHATYRRDATFDFPVGTIISKTFYYTAPVGTATPQTSTDVVKMTPASYQSGVDGLDLRHVRLIETRLLVRRAAGWIALPYVWNAEGTDATLERTGADVALTLDDGKTKTGFDYAVPNQNQCAGCHVTDYRDRQLAPIGLKARHLNHAFAGPGGTIDQLQRLVSLGYLVGVSKVDVPQNVDWQDARQSVTPRARAYLDINCGHCHSATGPARTSGLWLDANTSDPRLLGMCKPPVAAGRGTGNRPFDVVPGHPETSIMAYRLQSRDPGEMMPELGRSLTHAEGVALVNQYLAALKGVCKSVDGSQRIARSSLAVFDS